MKYKVVLHKKVVKYLTKIPQKKKDAIKNTLKRLERGGFDILNVKKMHGEWKGYRRFRLGDIRIIFWVEEREKVIYVDYIGARGDIYKR